MPHSFPTRRASYLARDLMPANLKRRERVTLLTESQVVRLLNEQRPGADPQPEFILFVRMQGELVGLLRVALKKPSLRGRDIHHAEKRGVSKQFDVVVRARRCRRHEPVPDPFGLRASFADRKSTRLNSSH